MKSDKRVALVTGGSRGIGRAVVDRLTEKGILVAVVSQSARNPVCDLYIRADLSKRHERVGIVERVIETFGRIDILVNNAGAQHSQPAVLYGADSWDNQIGLMLSAPLELAQQAAAHMLAHDGGHIVSILSTAAFQGARNIAGYVAAKHGLLGLTRALAVEWAPMIRVNAIAPGLTETDMIAGLSDERREFLKSITPAGRFGMPDDIAGALMYLINSQYVYGQTIVVDGGWLAKNG